MTSGYKNEFDFIHYLNGKKFGEINILMQEVIQSLFPNIKNNDTIKAYKYGRYAKAPKFQVETGILNKKV